MATKKKAAPPWKRATPKKVQKRATKHLTPAQKKHAAQRAKSAGRTSPNMVDNMHEAQASKSPTKKKKTAAKKTTARKKTTTKRAAKKTTSKRSAKKTTSKRKATRKKGTRKKAKPREKDPRGGLTAAGRRAFKERDGSNLKPGVQKKQSEMSRTEMKRKGSWAVRFYGRSKLPALVDAKGKPTRFALSAAAWGEPVPKTEAAARKIADKGHRLLARAQG